jgi:RNA polymerase sigma factor (sigma-70 family)
VKGLWTHREVPLEGAPLANPPTTRPSLLVRLRDIHDQDAWRLFAGIYAPLVYGFARRHRLQEADAADLTQEVLRAVAERAGQLNYDRRLGSFRGWLFTVAHRKLCDFWTRQKRQGRGSGDTDVQELLEDRPARTEPSSASARRRRARSRPSTPRSRSG